MLSHKDSKELEKLEYPQELRVGDWFYAPGDKPDEWLLRLCKDRLEAQTLMGYVATYVRVPTTDGMIEGLGEDFFRLDHCVWDIVRAYPKKPSVFSHFGAIYRKAYAGEASDVAVTGATAEEALCELWKKVKG